MTRFIVAAEAARDIEEIVHHIAKDSVEAALELEEQLVSSFRTLAKFPNSGHSRKDLAGSRNLLFWSVGTYLVLYRAKSKTIEIVAVLHRKTPS